MENNLVKIDEKNNTLTTEDIKKYICPSANDKELFMFVEMCKAQNLNPFIREAYLIKYSSAPATMVVGKDVFTKRAQNHPKFQGFQAGIIAQSKDGSINERVGAFLNSNETLIGGWAKVFVEGYKEPVENRVSMLEYGSNQASWKKIPATMIRKVALVQSLREAFPDVLGGLYDSAEMQVELSEVKPVDIKQEIKKKIEIVKAKTIEVQDVTPEPEPEPEVKKEPKQSNAQARCEKAFAAFKFSTTTTDALLKAFDGDWELLLHEINQIAKKTKGLSEQAKNKMISNWVDIMSGVSK